MVQIVVRVEIDVVSPVYVCRYRETNLDAGVGPAGVKVDLAFGYLLLALGPARS